MGFFSSLFGFSSKTSYENIGPEEFGKLMQSPGTVVVDVRTPGEVRQGYIKGTKLFLDVMGSGFAQGVGNLDREKTYLVYCRSGNRSARACSLLAAAGFTHVYNLRGGISGWSGPLSR